MTEELSKQHISIQGPEELHSCADCGKTFPSKRNLSWHIRTHSKKFSHKCQYCEKTFYSNTNLKHHIPLHTGVRPKKCQECDESFAQTSSLLQHMRIHTGKFPYTCTQGDACRDIGFTHKQGLRKHLASHHRSLYLQYKKYICELCWEHFHSEQELTAHTRRSHEKHRCKICGYQFSMMSHLKEHLLRHTGFKPFGCKLCPGFKLLRKVEVKEHITKFHPDQDYNTVVHETPAPRFHFVTAEGTSE